MRRSASRSLLLQLALAAAALLLATASAQQPSRLSVDFSSAFTTTPGNAPPAVLAEVDSLLRDMRADGVNSLCTGRLPAHVCGSARQRLELSITKPKGLLGHPLSLQLVSDDSGCALCMRPPANASRPCFCSAPGGKTRCTCDGTLTGKQYFTPKNYNLEFARVLVVSSGEANAITDGNINANFNSTVRLIGSKLTVKATTEEGAGDLELDESHLDLLAGSELLLQDDADLEVEDNGSLWMAGGSKLTAAGASNIQTQLAHVLVEGGSSISVLSKSEWNVTQEFDMTPAQAAAVCNQRFMPNAAAELCFKNKQACQQRYALLSGPERQALGMLKYPPELDKFGRQAFDYTDDNAYDDYYDNAYEEPALEAGACLGADICGKSAAAGSGRRLLAAPAPAPEPADAESDGEDGSEASKSTNFDISKVTEINDKDSVDGRGYDAAWGEGPYGESLCDAPPNKAFNYYGMLVREGSRITIDGGSSWTLYDQSRVFIRDSTVQLKAGAKLHLMNSTLVLINTTLVVGGGSEILLEKSSAMHLFASRVLGDNALYGVPAGATWGGKPWVSGGDYRASPGGGLPVFMGAAPGLPLGSYPMRIAAFDLEARLMPAAGCKCKRPRIAGTTPAASVITWPAGAGGARQGWCAPLQGLL